MPDYDLRASNGLGIAMAPSKKKGEEHPAVGHVMARAYAHPVRARALMILGKRVASPKEIAKELGEPIGKVSYHIRELRDMGMIELVETDRSRGGVQHFYRAIRLAVIDREEMEAQDAAERATSSSIVINLMVSDIATAVAHGTLDSRPERVLTRYHALVDQEGWEELSELHTNTMYRSIEIHEEAAERLRHSEETGIPAATHTLVFEMPSPEEVAMKKPRELTLKWADGGDPSLQEGGGSEGRRADDGDAP
jgi:DNA-binding transcriptional ArsR family regulator